MEDKLLVAYKWDSGIYKLEDMVKLVQNGIINKDQFFDITRCHFDKVKNTNE